MKSLALDYGIRKCHVKDILREETTRIANAKFDMVYYYDLENDNRKEFSFEKEQIFKFNMKVAFELELEEHLDFLIYKLQSSIEDSIAIAFKEMIFSRTKEDEVRKINNHEYYLDDRSVSVYELEENIKESIKERTIEAFDRLAEDDYIKVDDFKCTSCPISINIKDISRRLLDQYYFDLQVYDVDQNELDEEGYPSQLKENQKWNTSDYIMMIIVLVLALALLVITWENIKAHGV